MRLDKSYVEKHNTFMEVAAVAPRPSIGLVVKTILRSKYHETDMSVFNTASSTIQEE